jgi:Trk-type K+ transport system membrane component
MVSEPLRAWRRLRGGQPVNLSLSWAIGWAAIFMAILGVALLVLLALQPQTPADRLLFDAISALSLTGLTFNPISQTGPALYTLCILMLAGRLIPFALLHAQSRAATIPQVAVG